MKRYAIDIRDKEQIYHACKQFENIIINLVERERKGEAIFPTSVEVIVEK